MKINLITSTFLLGLSSTSAFAHATSASPPAPPVVSAPLKPGECVVACPAPASGQGGVTVEIKGVEVGIGGGGNPAGKCELFCAPPTPPSGSLDSCSFADPFFGCTTSM